MTESFDAASVSCAPVKVAVKGCAASFSILKVRGQPAQPGPGTGVCTPGANVADEVDGSLSVKATSAPGGITAEPGKSTSVDWLAGPPCPCTCGDTAESASTTRPQVSRAMTVQIRGDLTMLWRRLRS